MIGPNGAGKTTLINQISGLLASGLPGVILFAGRDITALPMHARARSRVGANVPGQLDTSRIFGARECRARGASARRLELPTSSAAAAAETDLNRPAMAALAEVDLADRASRACGTALAWRKARA